MKTNEFLSLLKENPNKSLLFEYKEGQFVGANYHITEIKNITIDSVDCGAGVDFWKETIIQLWESPDEHEKEEYMSAYKALGILIVADFTIDENKLVMKLSIEKTDCKARETCGVPVAVEANEASSCAPGGGCC